MQERRGHVRLNSPVLIQFPNPATLKTEQSFTHDVSETGLRFPTTVKLQVGQELALTLEVPFERSAFHATGDVVWIREIARLGATQYDIGVRFRWIEDPDRNRLERHLHTLLSTKV